MNNNIVHIVTFQYYHWILALPANEIIKISVTEEDDRPVISIRYKDPSPSANQAYQYKFTIARADIPRVSEIALSFIDIWKTALSELNQQKQSTVNMID